MMLTIDHTLNDKQMTMKTSKIITLNEAKLGLQGTPLKSVPVPLSALVDSYAAAAQSSATQRSYDADLRHFKRHGGTIPASAEMIAEYLAAFAGKSAIATLQHRLVAIHRAHTDHNIPSPVMDRLVKRTMQGIRRTFGTVQRRVKALVKDDLLEMMVHIDQQRPMKAARDKVF